MGGGCPGKTKNDIEPEYHRSMFIFNTVVGKGGFGRVWKVQLKRNRQVFALKIMSKAKIITKKSVQSVMNQKLFLQNIEDKFIINMMASFQDRQNLYLVMDYLSGGDLRYYINRKIRFTQTQIKFIIRCLVEALRDIKPENIVFQQSGYCRVTDLGVAREWRPDNSNETSGTPGYMAPEVMCRQNHSFCADYFAIGVICYQLMMGTRPYLGNSRKAIRDQILAKQAKIPEAYGSFSKDMIDFTNQLIQRKVKNRLGYGGINEVIQHPWIKMSTKQQSQFQAKKCKPLFIPSKDRNFDRIAQQSEPNDLQRQTILLLKKQNVQDMFQDYDFQKNKDSKACKASLSTKNSIHSSDHKKNSEAQRSSVTLLG